MKLLLRAVALECIHKGAVHSLINTLHQIILGSLLNRRAGVLKILHIRQNHNGNFGVFLPNAFQCVQSGTVGQEQIKQDHFTGTGRKTIQPFLQRSNEGHIEFG